jgi:hypothetical protein
MGVQPSVGRSCGYVLTSKGRLDMRDNERCVCEIRIRGGVVECRHCETVYGLVRDMFAHQYHQPWGGKGA